MKHFIVILFLAISKLASAQIINGGFEQWDTTFTAEYSTDLINEFNVPNPLGGVPRDWKPWGIFGICRTTDSYSGNYSLILYNWYTTDNDSITYHDSISSRPLYLNGYFKYIVGNVYGISEGTAKISLTRFNGVSNDTIAKGTYQFDSAASFTPFQIVLNYISQLNPDSISVYFINAHNWCNTHSNVCNLLYLDNLSLGNSPLGIENLKTPEYAVTLYPNPVQNLLEVQCNSSQQFHFTLLNTLGERVITKTLSVRTNEIDLSSYSEGLYFYRITVGEEVIKTGKIAKQ